MVIKIKPKLTDSIKVIQITDTHILDDDAASFNGFDTSASLKKVLNKIKLEEKELDLILLTGDLVQDATDTSYQKLLKHLSILSVPVLSLPGNHDNPAMLDDNFNSNGHDIDKVVQMGEWCIVLLNSCVIGSHSGELADPELAFLRKTLENNTNKHCLIALHHHPVSIDSPWMDSMILINGDKFLSVVDDNEQVRAIIWGHIHQKFESKWKNVTLLGSPSTCMQFMPKAKAFAIDDKPAGFRKMILRADGNIDTEVIYIQK